MARPCPCCGYLTFDEEHGTYDICPVCYWEDDPIQEQDPNYSDGANRVSLSKAKKNFNEYGACEEEYWKKVRKPYPEEIPQAN